MAKLTEELLNKIKTATDALSFVKENEESFITESPEECLARLMKEKGLKAADVARRSGQGEYVYKVLGGSRRASRDVTLSICFGMGLSLEETQRLLRVSRYAPLDPRSRRDSVIIYGICSNTGADGVNDILFELGERTL